MVEDSLSASNKDHCVSFSNLSNADVPNKHRNDLCCREEDDRRKGRGRSSNDNDKKKKGWDAVNDGKGLVVNYIRVKYTMPISYLVDLTLLLHHQLLSLSLLSSSSSLLEEDDRVVEGQREEKRRQQQ